jgi:hypothetical protein
MKVKVNACTDQPEVLYGAGHELVKTGKTIQMEM